VPLGPNGLPSDYALAPALASDQYLVWTETANVKLYYKAIAPLATKFDLSQEKMKDFLESLFDKAKDINWDTTLMINYNGAQYNLIQHYGMLSLVVIKQHVMTYHGTATRHAQNSRMMFACLRESLTEEARQKVSLESHKYRINTEPDGLLYFKVIVGIAHLDTRATITVIRTRLSSLDTKMADVQDNIIELNAFVKLQQAGLEARGQKTDDLLVNLFKAYKACRDAEFLTWVKRAEDNYNEGTDITPEELMTLADNKYQSLLDAGTWLQQTEDQKKIVAMAAQIHAMEKSRSAGTTKKDGKKGVNTNPKKTKKEKNSKKTPSSLGSTKPRRKDNRTRKKSKVSSGISAPTMAKRELG
jgi:hypothetical protein